MMSTKEKSEDVPAAVRFCCGFSLFLLLPFVATLAAPSYFVVATRVEAGMARADVYPCVFFFIPRGHDRFGPIERVEADVVKGRLQSRRVVDDEPPGVSVKEMPHTSHQLTRTAPTSRPPTQSAASGPPRAKRRTDKKVM